jgi:hypothetical protein
LLIPFTFSNLAMWMEPPARGLTRRIMNGLSRLLALTTTLTLVTACASVALDLIAWQCGSPANSCPRTEPLLDVVFSGVLEPPGRRLAVAALIPIGLVVLLWIPGRLTWARYESYILTPGGDPNGTELARPEFWNGREQVGRLRSLHLASALALIDVLLLRVLARHDSARDAFAGVAFPLSPDQVRVTGTMLEALTALVVLVSVLLLLAPRVVDRGSESTIPSTVTTLLRSVAVAITVMTLLYACLPRAPWLATGPMSGPGTAAGILMAIQVALVAGSMIAVVFLRRLVRGAIFAGFGAPIVAYLGAGLAAVMAGGLAVRAADLLNGGAGLPAVDRSGISAPIAYQWAMVGLDATAIAVALVSIWTALVTRPWQRRQARRGTDEDFPGGRAHDPQRAARIDRALAKSRLADQTVATYGWLWTVLAAGSALATGLAVVGTGPLDLAAKSASDLTFVAVNIGSYLANLLIVVLLLLGVQAYRVEGARRVFGALWDVGTFWPRACHPLAPPCYGERIVPELAARGSWLANGDRRLLLSGDSQGSVYAAAAVLHMPRVAQRNTALLTTGSPLGRTYNRLFPAYFNDDALAAIGEAVAGPRGLERWINLWRRTDPTGGIVGVGDRRLADPSSFEPSPGDTTYPPIRGHSGYRVERGYAMAADDLRGLLDNP